MLHHDQRPYETAASNAAAAGREKMQQLIEEGKSSAEAVIQQVESRLVDDNVIRSSAARFEPGTDGFWLSAGPEFRKRLHQHAFRQVLDRAEVPGKFADHLASRDGWGRDLLAYNLNKIYEHRKERQLVRSVGDEIRGFLSDRFRRLDSRPLLAAFIEGCQKYGLVPIEGYALDTKVRLRAVLPKVFEPIPNEVMLFGLEWANSDFGDGGHCVSLFTMRIWCTNLAIGSEVLRQVHLGKRLDDSIEYSQKTYALDTDANASALRDVVQFAVGPDRVHAYLDVIRQANTQEIKGRDGVKAALRRLLDTPTIDRVADLFDSPDVVNLPPGHTVYRLSNAVSWLAQSADISPIRRLDLQRAAGQLLPSVEMKSVEV